MKTFMGETESIKVSKDQVNRVRLFVATKPYTIGGYVSELIRKDMDKIDSKESKKKSKS